MRDIFPCLLSDQFERGHVSQSRIIRELTLPDIWFGMWCNWADTIALQQIKSGFRIISNTFLFISGEITFNELGRVMRNHGLHPTDEELRDMIRNVDKNSNGAIDFNEFIEMMLRRDSKIEEDVAHAFRVFDRDGDGLISEEELRLTMNNLGEPLTDQEASQKRSSLFSGFVGSWDHGICGERAAIYEPFFQIYVWKLFSPIQVL